MDSYNGEASEAALRAKIKINKILPPPDPGRNLPKTLDLLNEKGSPEPPPGPPRGRGGTKNKIKIVLC